MESADRERETCTKTRATWVSSLGVSLVALALGACGGEIVPGILRVYGQPASHQLEISVDTCNAQPTVLVDETTSRVRLTVRTEAPLSRNGDDCLDGVNVTLTRPLGQRTIIDTSTGSVVKVLTPDN